MCRYSVATKQEIDEANYDTTQFAHRVVIDDGEETGNLVSSDACIKCDKNDCLVPEIWGNTDFVLAETTLNTVTKTNGDICNEYIIEGADTADGDAFRKQFAVRHYFTVGGAVGAYGSNLPALFCLSEGKVQSLIAQNAAAKDDLTECC